MTKLTYSIAAACLLLGTAHCVVQEGDDGSGGSSSSSGDGGDTTSSGSGGSTASSGSGGSTSSSGSGGSTSSSGSGGSTSSSGSGGSTSSSGSGGSPGGVQTCGDLCALTPVDPGTAYCVAGYIAALGYDVSHALCSGAITNTPQGCLACYGAISVDDADCVGAHASCF